MPNLSVNISGSGAVVADSLTVTGAVNAGSLDVTGNAVLRGNTTQGTTGKIQLRSGNANDLPLQFASDLSSGIYLGNTNIWCLTTNGLDTLQIRYGLALTAYNIQATNLAVVGGAFTAGATTLSGTLTMDGDLNMQAGRKLAIDNSTSTSSCPLQFRGNSNNGISYLSNNNFALVGNSNGRAVINAAGLTVFNGALYLEEIAAAPGAVANYSVLYSLDVAGKTQFNAKQGNAGTTVQLAVEA